MAYSVEPVGELMRMMNVYQDYKGAFTRKLAAIVAAAAVLTVGFAPIEAKAADVLVNCSVSGTFTVSDEAGQVVAKNGSTCSGTAVIPSGVTSISLFQNNLTLLRVDIPASVTTIASHAFANSRNLETVTIASNSALTRIPAYVFSGTKVASLSVPALVTSIGEFALAGVTNFTSLTFESGSTLQSIEYAAFRGTRLSSVSFPASLVTLGNEAFKDNTTLASVTFGAGSQLTTLRDEVFKGLPESTIALPASLTTVGISPFGTNIRLTVPAENQSFSLENGVLFNKARTTLVAYAPWLTADSFEIPASVTTIGPWAFADSQLRTLNIPATVSTMGVYTFARSNRLTEVTFSPNSAVTRIPTAAFQASGLLRITIPASVTFIEGYALNASLLNEVTFEANSGLQEISNNVFQQARLTSIEIPASVHTIGSNAFTSNTLLTAVAFSSGSNLRYLGSGALGNRVTTLSFPATPVRSGYRFNGWSNTANGAVVSNATTSAIAGQELFAKWIALSSVTFNSTSGSAVANGSFGSGETVAEPTAPTRAGYAFAGWSLTNGGAAVTFPYLPSSSANFTMYALWNAVPTVSAGAEPDSQVVSIPAGITAAEVPATANLPRVSLAFAATNASASATIVPIENPAAVSSTPFAVTSSTKIVDILVSGITGPVTVCIDGASTDEVFHFTGGAWVALPQRTFANGQVCGVTESFSPFTAAAPAPIVQNVTYTGPRISGRANKIAPTSGGSEFTIFGNRLAQVSSVTIEGKALTVVSKSDDQIVVKTPAHAVGFVDLVLKSGSTELVYQDAFEYRAPATAKARVTTSNNIPLSNASAKALTASQQKALRSFVASANVGAVLNCQVTYVSKSELAAAKSLATNACAVAKKSNPYLTTRVLVPAIVKDKSARKVLLSLTR